MTGRIEHHNGQRIHFHFLRLGEHHRTDFAASMIDGRTVMEVDPNGRSAAEVTQLWNYISDRLEKNFRRTVFAPAPNGQAQQLGGLPRPSGGFGRRVAQ